VTTLVGKEDPVSKLPVPAQELRFLRYIAQHGPLTVGRVAEELGAELGLARSTVLTVMERLRRKGHLRRRRSDGVFVYASTLDHDRLMRATVGQFVERALGGSVLPIAAWLSDRVEVTEEELAELRAIVSKLRPKKEGS
jgi:predicted transcriptional regulator